ncbi:MAG: hypothetical protein LBR81_06430 [Prevotellaceae bacterium]|jgi:hypothetical protein|nr:hypothetical protein [Prevotellaceae bacterium]
MSALVKMKIFGFDNENYSGSSKFDFAVQVNPNTIKFDKSIQLTDKQIAGLGESNKTYSKHKETSFGFDVLLDATGVISPIDIKEQVEKLEKTVYTLNGETHQPNFVKISWGDFLFKGILHSMNYEYTLFTPEGKPLRVKISLSFCGYMSLQEAAKKENKQSPDLSRIITLKAGESIPYWCNEIYGDASHCTDIARHNRLTGFLNVKPGTELMFPPLIRVES